MSILFYYTHNITFLFPIFAHITMAKKKLKRFGEIKTYSNVLEYPEHVHGTWHTMFANTNPIVLELACGRGEYTIGMSEKITSKNFIGVDIKGNRMYIGAKKALDENRSHVRFLRTQIERIATYFAPNEVDEIWITFPDPFLRESKQKNRLTHHKFLAMYQQFLKPNGIIHLKTDSKPLFDFTLEMIAHHQCTIHTQIENVYAHGEPAFPLNILTHYESMHLQEKRTIQYVCFSLPSNTIIIPPKKKKVYEEEAF